jgi:hypothetical protein
VEALTKATKGLEAGWVHDNVAVGLLVFPILVLVSFVGCSPIGVDGYNAHVIWVATGDVDEVMRHVFAAEGDDIESEVRFAGDR